MSTALIADDEINAEVARWVRDMQSVRRLAPKTVEAYQRDLGQFLNFLGPHTGGPVSLAALRDMRGADVRAFLASRREDGVEPRSLARGLSAIKSFFRFLEREGVVTTEALNIVRTPRAKK
jgi:integrase/recombinase XerC